METKIASSSSVELLDKDMQAKTENCNYPFGHTVYNGKPTGESNDHREIHGSAEICQPLPRTSFSRKSGLFYCLKCGCRFRKLENLISHRKRNCSVHCNPCGLSFECVADLRRHQRAHHMSPDHGRKLQLKPRELKKPVECCRDDGNISACVAEDQKVTNPHQSIADETSSSYCETNSVQSIDNRKHESNDHHEIHGSAEICQPPNTSFCRKSGLFYCLKCGCRFRQLENLISHRKRNCSVRCNPCGLSFECVANLRRHQRAHHGRKFRRKTPQEPKKHVPCVCSHCGQVFKSTTYLKYHIHTHTGERPFECRVDGCTKRFAQQSTRAFHERTHSDDKPHICSVCGRRFKHAGCVYLHMRVHTGVKPYHCPSCSMTFRTASCLQRHSHCHSEERRYSCAKCPKRFKVKKSLDKHILALHSDKIPYRCSVCDKGFKTSGNLRIHMRVHTGDRPFICAVCGVRFAYPGSLKSHMQAHLGSD